MLIALSILSAYPTDGRQAATFLQLKMGFGVYQSISYNLTMKRFGTSLCLLGSLACSLTVLADDQVTPDNPYAAIVARNVFGLVPPPPPAPPEDPAVKNPPPKITPNGIMSIFGKWQALFKVMPVAKPGEPPPKDGFKEESHMLAEGESEDEITVVKINSKDGIITFDNHGITQELPLLAATATGPAPAPGGPPGAPGGPGGLFGGPGMMNRPGMPGRFGNRPGMFGGGRPDNNQPSQQPAPTQPSGGFGVAGRPDPNQITPEQQILLMEANRSVLEQKGDPSAALIPMTSLTQQIHQENGAGSPNP